MKKSSFSKSSTKTHHDMGQMFQEYKSHVETLRCVTVRNSFKANINGFFNSYFYSLSFLIVLKVLEKLFHKKKSLESQLLYLSLIFLPICGHISENCLHVRYAKLAIS